ncbi:hypothetical protein [Billgrantia sp. C5P2]|uniref:hypothetical protein n=1 Tax=Billgrantia sp. C5P2 TaxID=3436239 RepID=UPI003DA2CC3B
MKLIADVLGSLGKYFKYFLVLNFLLFLFFVVLSVYAQFSYPHYISNFIFIALAVLELSLIKFSDYARKEYLRNVYTNEDVALAPPEEVNHQDVRYLMFRRRIIEENIIEEDIVSMFDIIAARLEMESSVGVYTKGFLAFLGALFIASYSYVIDFVGEENVFGLVLSILAAGVFVFFILSLMPSKIEKIKELKYFLSLYKQELLSS